MMGNGNVQFINPDSLMQPIGFTQVISVTGPHKTIYVGGQNSVDKDGNMVGKGDVAAQAGQVLRNMEQALRAAGATWENIVKWNIYMVQGHDPGTGFQVFQKIVGNIKNLPTITVVQVAGLVRPDFLLEIDAVAVVPE